jgi:hypothetical protein
MGGSPSVALTGALALVLCAVACSGGGSPAVGHVSSAAVQAALVPLSDMPAGTSPIRLGGGTSASCTGSKHRLAPVVHAQVGYAQPFGPKADGAPAEIEALSEEASVHANGTATQLMNDLRALRSCSTKALSFPRVANDQVSYQLQVPNVGPIDFIYLRVNDSTILVVTAAGPSNAQTRKATEDFARKAYTRAKSMLG